MARGTIQGRVGWEAEESLAEIRACLSFLRRQESRRSEMDFRYRHAGMTEPACRYETVPTRIKRSCLLTAKEKAPSLVGRGFQAVNYLASGRPAHRPAVGCRWRYLPLEKWSPPPRLLANCLPALSAPG